MYPLMMTNCIAPFGCNPFAGYMTGYALGYSLTQPRNFINPMYCNPFMFNTMPYIPYIPYIPRTPITPIPLFGSYTCRYNVTPQGSESLTGDFVSSPSSSSSFTTTDWDEVNRQYESKFNDSKSKAFLDKVKEIAKRLNCDYRDLLAVMNSESGLNPRARNKSSGATGLIQFMPATAKELGTTVEALRNMSAVQQLDYVEKYLQMTKRRAGFGQMQPISGGQLYALIFLPGRAKREVLTKEGEKYYKSGKCDNSVLDVNGDKKITISDLDARVKSHYVA